MQLNGMYRNLQARFLKLLDLLLTEPQRRLPPDERNRLRVLVGAAALNLLLAMSNMLGPEAPAHGTFFRAVGVVFSAGYLSTLILVRRRASIRLPALILCSTLTAGIMLSVRLIGTPETASHAAIMLTPALAVYLLGARLGFVFTLVMGLNVLVLNPLSWRASGAGGPLFPNELARFAAISAGLALLAGWILSWMYSTAREGTLAALRESEGRLLSLIESTDDLVCSFDARGNLITANRAVKSYLPQLANGAPSASAQALSESFFQRLLPGSVSWRKLFVQALAGQPGHFEVSSAPEGKPRVWQLSLSPILGVEGKPVGVTLFGRDITSLKDAEARLGELHRSLLEVSRQAGKAEIATSVLHNVGNTLNSLTVSAELVDDQVRGLRLDGVAKAAKLLTDNAEDLSAFLTMDERGRKLPEYLWALSRDLSQKQESLATEVAALRQGVEHIRAVVSVQEEQARPAGVLERVFVSQLIDDALRLQGASFERAGIQLRTEYGAAPPVLLDRHKLLQILVNLLSNARHALAESARPDKRLTLRVERTPADRLRIQVADNGVGILPEHLPLVFAQGFTTRKAGHGFGLHLSALAARELGGSLTCESGGREQGATFTLELPLEPDQPPAAATTP